MSGTVACRAQASNLSNVGDWNRHFSRRNNCVSPSRSRASNFAGVPVARATHNATELPQKSLKQAAYPGIAQSKCSRI